MAYTYYKLVGQGTSNMTSLQGRISATYEEMVAAFGEPHYSEPSGDGKVNTEWELEFFDIGFNRMIMATIYDWKDYDGGLRSRNGQPYEWHIGGHNQGAWAAVDEVLKESIANREFEEEYA